MWQGCTGCRKKKIMGCLNHYRGGPGLYSKSPSRIHHPPTRPSYTLPYPAPPRPCPPPLSPPPDTGTIPSLLYVTNSTRAASHRLLPPADAHLAVESSGGAASVGVLSPRGAASAVRFGSTGLPYSGGISVLHHPDGPGETKEWHLDGGGGEGMIGLLVDWSIGSTQARAVFFNSAFGKEHPGIQY